jgi:16S rRNA processing protein RimM
VTEGDELVIVGRIRRPHGIRGEVLIEAITDEPDAVYASGRHVFAGTVDGTLVEDTPRLTIESTRPFKDGILIVFHEIADRTEAERWNGRFLFVPAGELTPLAEGEVYVHELPGMTVELSSGERVGTIGDVFEVPQGLLLDVIRERGSVLVPFADDIVIDVDRERRVVRIDPPEGLLE